MIKILNKYKIPLLFLLFLLLHLFQLGNIPNGIKEMKLRLNNQDYDIDLGSEYPVDITIDKASIPYVEGNNELLVTVVSKNDAVVTESISINYQVQ